MLFRVTRELDTMEIDFIFDAACPWSYIGKHRLERAIAKRPVITARIKWVPFILNPEISDQGANRQFFLSKQFGSDARIRRMHETLINAGKPTGIEFNFDLIEKVPSTLSAHRLIQMAAVAEKGNEAAEEIFKSYFTDGSDISDHQILVGISEKIGLNGDEIRQRLETEEFSNLVFSENSRAHRLGINGVPSFVCNGSMVISGAQGTKILTRVMDAAIAEIKIGRTQASFG